MSKGRTQQELSTRRTNFKGDDLGLSLAEPYIRVYRDSTQSTGRMNISCFSKRLHTTTQSLNPVH